MYPPYQDTSFDEGSTPVPGSPLRINDTQCIPGWSAGLISADLSASDPPYDQVRNQEDRSHAPSREPMGHDQVMNADGSGDAKEHEGEVVRSKRNGRKGTKSSV